jgi:ADP-heptose:LPS heptosyltransferase/GT2 family glycosyltransferase
VAGFRPGEDLQPSHVAASTPEALAFTAQADAGGTDFDVLMGYQMFLGRDPESSFVIADAKSSPVGAFIRALLGSGEFQSAVVDRLAAGRPLPHETTSSGPSREQLDWLFRQVLLPPRAELALRGRQDWRDWLRMFISVPGVPAAPGRVAAADAAKPALEAVPVSDGFVLIQIERPKPGDSLHPGALLTGTGWVIAPSDVAEVSVHLDDVLITHARYGLPRPDVARSFPHYRHVDHCGFSFSAELPPTLRLHARSELSVCVRTERGDTGRRAVRLAGEPARARSEPVSSAATTWPIRLAVEEAVVDADRTLRVRGWAISRAPMHAVTVMLGEAVLGEAKHGLPRTDIPTQHAGYANAAQSGFTLVHQLGEDVAAGPGFVRVTATDGNGQTRQTIVPVSLPPLVVPAPPAGPASVIRCSCDAATLTPAGKLTVGGWAIAPGGIGSIHVELDGIAAGPAAHGRPRPDVGRRFPDDPDAARSGFLLSLDLPRPPAQGAHTVTLRLTGRGGAQRVLEHPVVVQGLPGAAPAPARPAASGAQPPHRTQPAVAGMRLEVDRPKLDGDRARETVRGALTIGGWTVARQGIESVSIYCDETPLGNAYLGMRREDIGAAYPEYKGSLRAGYALVLPPGSLPEGTHRIRIVARAEAGPGGAEAVVERGFSLTVEPYDAVPPGGGLRRDLPPAEAEFGLNLLQRLGVQPQFDVLVTVPVTAEGQGEDLAALRATLETLHAQAYPDWKAVVSCAGAPPPAAQALADQSMPGRVSLLAPVQPAPPNARAAPRRSAAKAAKAASASRNPAAPRFILCLRAGDLLGADALLELAVEAAGAARPDMVYADELRHDPAQNRVQPFFKPDWSPQLLLSMNYVGRPWCASAELLTACGLTEASLPGVSDYDTVLRLTEHAKTIRHVQRVLCQRGPAADTAAEEQAALTSCLARRRLSGSVIPGSVAGTWRVRRDIRAAKPARGGSGRIVPGRVSVIMPTCAARGLVRIAVKTIRANSAPARPDGREVEIVIVDNTKRADTRTRTWLRRHADQVIDMPDAFNWSRFNNAGARAATGEYLLFLNDDIEVRDPNWLDALLEHAQDPGVGVVGARLLYPDGKVQHGGQYLADTHARHAFRFADAANPGPFGIATVAREMISVTGACQMVRADVFARLGGYDEAHSVVNNDLDFCLRSWQAGLAVIFTPHVSLIHHELASRASLQDSYDEDRFEGSWRASFLRGDPFRSRRLAPDSDHYGPDPEPPGLLFVGRRGPTPERVARILAVKLDHIGDFLTALPALRSLRRRFPAATIDLLAPAATAELARRAPGPGEAPLFGEIIVFDFFHARSGDGQKDVGVTELAALQARLAPRDYDIAVDLRMQSETRHVLPYSGARLLAGYDRGNQFPFLDVALEWEGDTKLVAKRGHISERLIQLVSATEDACRAEALPPNARPLAAAAVPSLAALPAEFRARPIVCVHPGVGNTVRQWPPAQYAALVDLLTGEAGVSVVLIGAAEEAAIAEDVMRRAVAAPGRVESLVGRVRLADLPDVMRACVLFVGNNSGPQHLAASLGVPTIGIHSGVVDAAEWAPLGSQSMAIRRRMVCSPCYLEFASDCPRGLACLTGLQPREVFAQCRRLLG